MTREYRILVEIREQLLREGGSWQVESASRPGFHASAMRTLSAGDQKGKKLVISCRQELGTDVGEQRAQSSLRRR